MKTKFALVGGLLLGFCSCTGVEQEKPEAFRYFDNPGYFNQEITRLQNSGTGIHKTLVSNDKQTESATPDPNWEKELDLMQALTLNKASYLGSFSTDTLRDGNRIVIRHTQTGDKIPVKEYEIAYVNGRLSHLTARREDLSSLLNSYLIWRYVPDSGYTMYGGQEIAGLRSYTYRVSARFAD